MTDVQLFIGGRWRDGSRANSSDIVNPATEESIGRVAHAGADDVDRGGVQSSPNVLLTS
jgi:succinate-semialdehyde dehydrogenase/glutarate-semialdehyde dehydrogenase